VTVQFGLLPPTLDNSAAKLLEIHAAVLSSRHANAVLSLSQLTHLSETSLRTGQTRQCLRRRSAQTSIQPADPA
jgi:hypothetical protein